MLLNEHKTKISRQFFFTGLCFIDVLLYSSIMKRYDTFLYKDITLLFLKRSEIGCKCKTETGRWRTWTQIGRGLLYWPFLKPHCDSIIRALRPCFFDRRFSIGIPFWFYCFDPKEQHCSCLSAWSCLIFGFSLIFISEVEGGVSGLRWWGV